MGRQPFMRPGPCLLTRGDPILSNLSHVQRTVTTKIIPVAVGTIAFGVGVVKYVNYHYLSDQRPRFPR